jgi:hypothetical protein
MQELVLTVLSLHDWTLLRLFYSKLSVYSLQPYPAVLTLALSLGESHVVEVRVQSSSREISLTEIFILQSLGICSGIVPH